MATKPRSGRTAEADIELDFRNSRRLTGVEEWCWYVFAGLTYIIVGIWHKWVLNWLIGPLWLIMVIVAGPLLVDHLRALAAKRRA